ncbi:MAG TPA: PQQ-binding-like beta-propeller repeat protein [Methanobacterium sp.]
MGSVNAAGGLANSPQPKINHDNQNTGQSQYTGPQTNTSQWKFTTYGNTTSEPSVGSDGTIYFGNSYDPSITGYGGGLLAVNPNGTEKWEYTTTGQIKSTPAIGSDGTIYAAASYDGVYALDTKGNKKWKYALKNLLRSSPAIGSDGSIYFGCDDNLYALNPNGALKWKYKTGNWISESSPAIRSDGTIYIGSTDYYLYALNPNGTLKWKYQTGGGISASPVIKSDGTIYTTSWDGYLYAINSNGTLKWKYHGQWSMDAYPSLGSDGTIYIGTDHTGGLSDLFSGSLIALNPNGTLKWKYITDDWVTSAPTIGSDGTIYISTCFVASGKVIAITPNGTKKWEYNIDDGIYSSPVIGGNRILYFVSHLGDLISIQDLTANVSPAGGTYSNTQSVTLKMNKAGNIYYTLNGATPTTSSTKYSGPIVISSNKTLKYLAVDLAGNKSPVYTQTYKVKDTVNPTITATPVGGTYNAKKSVTLKLSEPGTIYYTLNGSTPTISSAKYTNPITIIATTTLKYFARDSAGRSSTIYTQTYKIDKTPPSITKFDPANNAVNVVASKTIKVTFSENIKSGSKAIQLKNSSGKAIAFTESISGKVLTIKPKSKLAESKYKLILNTGSVTDTASNPLKAKTITFSVGASPTVKSSDPKNSATKVAHSKTIKVTFSENIKAGSNYRIELVNSKGAKVTIKKSIKGKILTITHTAKLKAKTKYKLTLYKGSVTDAAGNPLKAKTISFTTGST